MKAEIIEILKTLKDMGGQLYVENNDLKLKMHRAKMNENLKHAIQEHKDDIIQYLKSNRKIDEANKIFPLPNGECYDLAGSQKRLWVICQYDEANASYNIPSKLELSGNYNVNILLKAINQVVDRHEILRTVFKTDMEGNIKQWVLTRAESGFAPEYIDLRNEPTGSEKVNQFIEKDSYVPFDLANGPLLRVLIFQIHEELFQLYCNIHHIICDGWSIEVIQKDIFAYYEAELMGLPLSLEPLKIQYKDYAGWINNQQFEESKEFWIKQLKGDRPNIDLPTEKKRPLIKQYKGWACETAFTKQQFEALRAFAHENGGSLFMALLAALKTLLYRYSETSPISLGMPIAGRELPELQNQIGLYANTIVLKTEISEKDTFKAVFSKVKDATLQAYQHQLFPLDSILDELEIKRDPSRNALFDIMVILQNTGDNNKIKNLDIYEDLNELKNIGPTYSKFDLTLSFEEMGDWLYLFLEYNPDVYTNENISVFIKQYKIWIDEILNNPDALIGSLNYLPLESVVALTKTKAQQKQIIYEKSIIEQIDETYKLRPDQIVYIYHGEAFTYFDILKGSKAVSRLLACRDVKQNDSVVLYLKSTYFNIVAMLGVLRHGAVYVSVDSSQPLDRLGFIISDCSSKFVIDDRVMENVFKQDPDFEEDYNWAYSQADTMSIIYTSGSVGQPKGVKISQSAVLNRLNWMWNRYPFEAFEICCVKTSVGFVDHIWEIFGPLLNGTTTILYDKKDVLAIDEFIESLYENNVTRIVLVPSLLKNILEHPKSEVLLQNILYWTCSGEALNGALVNAFYKRFPNSVLLNIYGSTEVTADCTVFDTSLYYGLNFEYNKSNALLFDGEVAQKILAQKISFLPNKIHNGNLDLINNEIYKNVNIQHPTNLEDFINAINEEIKGQLINVGAPKYLGHMTGPLPSTVIELNKIQSYFNQNLVKIETSGIASIIERQLIGIFHNLAYGFPNSFYQENIQKPITALGIVTNGGTISNITAINYILREILCCNENYKGLDKIGLPNALKERGFKSIKVIGSGLLHYSFEKAFKVCGLGTDALLEIPTGKNKDELYDELCEIIQKERKSGNLVLAILAVAGSTEAGIIEPLEVLGKVAHKFGIHFHVDCAFGGILLLSDRLKVKLAGIHYADSITICGHKQLLTPMGMSMLLFKKPNFVTKAENNARYQARKGSYDLGKFTIEGSRPFSAFILYSMLHIYGKIGYAELIESNCRKAKYFANLIKEKPVFDLFQFPAINIVLYRYVPYEIKCRGPISGKMLSYVNDLNINIQKKQFNKGESFVSYTEINSENGPEIWLRVVLMNPNTTKLHLHEVLIEQMEIANEIQGLATIKISIPEVDLESGVPIGKPIDNVDVFILDENKNICGAGIYGEIYVGGNCLSQGYLNDTALNEDKFISVPFYENGLLFRTGDIGRWRFDGNIEFHGRRDRQIKIRGNRLELGEIESVLEGHDAIKNCIVITSESSNGEYIIKAYLYFYNLLTFNEIIEFIKGRLPDYMIPSEFYKLKNIPLNGSGKIDQSKIHEFVAERILPHEEYKPPTTEIEKKIIELWQVVLNRTKIGLNDDFFDTGGHSIKLLKLNANYHKEFGVRVDIRTLFEKTKVFEHAQLIAQSDTDTWVAIPKSEEREQYPLAPSQERLWVLSKFKNASSAYNMPVYEELSGQYSISDFIRAVDATIDRHEILRTVFRSNENGEVFQNVLSADQLGFRVKYKDLRGVKNQRSLINKYVYNDFYEEFDLENGPLLRVSLLQFADNLFGFYYNLHHIICDGWSLGILSRDVLAFYKKFTKSEPINLPDLKIQFKDYVAWQAKYLNYNIQDSKAFWINHFSGEIPKIDLPSNLKRPNIKTYSGRSIRTYLSPELTTAIKSFNSERKGSLFIYLYSLFNVLIYKYTDIKDIVLGTSIANRDHQDLVDQIGFYVNMLPLRIELEPKMNVNEIYERAKSSVIQTFAHKDYPFDSLVRDLNVERDLGRNPIFDIMITLQNFRDSAEIKDSVREYTEEIIEDGEVMVKYDMDIVFEEIDNQILFSINYNSDIYEHKFAKEFMRRFVYLISSSIQNPNTNICNIDVLENDEKEKLLYVFNAPIKKRFSSKSLVDLFIQNSASKFDHFAIISTDRKVTFKELDELSNQIGRLLIDNIQVKPEARIGILIGRGCNLPIAILATLKAGCAYVPIGVDLPEERILYMIEDSNIEILITENRYIEFGNKIQWRSIALKHLICIDSNYRYDDGGLQEFTLGQKELWDHIGNSMDDLISIGGWVSSYTGQPFSEIEMSEYAENVYHKLEASLHKGMKVLEIGCSSGITLFKLAPLVKEYHGTDISQSILLKTEQAIKNMGLINVKLSCLSAHQIDQYSENEFDLIIINSVVHYFPGFNYLRDVLVKAIGLTKNSGMIFLGDLMDENRRQLLVESLNKYKANSMNKQTKTDWSRELFIPKGYLTDLMADGLGIADVYFSEKIHTIKNELTEFRYDAILSINKNIKKREIKLKKQKQQYEYVHFCNLSINPLDVNVFPENLAYLIYTSGSTGKPKGVLVEHKNVASFIENIDQKFSFGKSSKIAATTNYTFDISVLELLGSICTGRTAVIFTEEDQRDSKIFMDKINEEGVEVLQLTPTRLLQLGHEFFERKFDNLKIILVGGEPLSEDLYLKLKELSQIRSYNCYGPTETTIWSTCLDILLSDRLSIGKPLFNENVYILNEFNALVPIGVAGELCIGGEGVSRGYLNNSDLTESKFIVNPFNSEELIYKTGDVARWMPDSTIDYIGRLDDQIKLRGYRIELDEIANTLSLHELISSAVILVRLTGFDKHLVAYYVSENTIPVFEMQQFLSAKLPHYMVPHLYVRIDELPITANGKINKVALLNLNAITELNRSEYLAPTSQTEIQLVKLWESLLGIQQIGVKDNFFLLGGNSLHVVQLLAKINKQFKVKLNIEEVFNDPTIKRLAEVINSLGMFTSEIVYDESQHNKITI